MPGGRGAKRWLPRSVGVLATGEPTADSTAGAVLARLRAGLPAEVALSFCGPRSADPPGLPAGVRRAASPADLAARAELLVVVVAELDAVRDLINGPAGVQAGVHSPTIQILGCTCPPEALRTLAAELDSSTAGRLRTVDAPLVGQAADIRAGRLPILAGAARETFEAAEPLLCILGPTTWLGGVGHGQIGAAGMRYLLAATMAALVETSVIVRRSGVDLATLLDSWRATDLMGRVVDDVSSRLLGLTEDAIAPTSWSSSLTVARAEAVRTHTRTALMDVVFDAYAEAISNPGDDVIRRLERAMSIPHTHPVDADLSVDL